jgi:hypothetical protein
MSLPVKLIIRPPDPGPARIVVTNPIQPIRVVRVSPTVVPGPGLPAGVTMTIVGSADQFAEFTLPDNSKKYIRLLNGPAPV